MLKKYEITTNEPLKTNLQEWWDDKQLSYEDLSESDMIRLVSEVDFELHCIENKFRKVYHLQDWQGGNLGDVESEIFSTIKEACSRLETYYIDWFNAE